MKKPVTIIGAGLVGSLLSVFLAKRGYKVDVFEKRPDPRKAVADSGRSINLALSHRGIKALKEAGLAERVLSQGIAMEGRMIHDEHGITRFQPYGEKGEVIYSVSRALLNRTMIEAADEYEAIRFHFSHRCNEPDLQTQTVTLQDLDKNKDHSVHYSLLIGADGAFSPVRTALMKTDRVNYSQHYLEHGYLELTIPARGNSHVFASNALHIWPRHTFMLIALPNTDGSFTCTLFLPFEGETSFASLDSDTAILGFFEKNFPDVVPMMPNLVNDFREQPPSSLVTVRSYPWSYKDSVLLIGDAAHAIVPFYGQGMNAGFEDCFALNALLNESREDWTTTIKVFEQIRKEDADAVAELALKNFIEMRDKVADPQFLLRKKIEALIHERLGKRYLPLYSMVTFSDMSYSEAMKIGELQERMMDRIMQTPGIEELWDKEEFWNILEKQVEDLYEHFQ